MGRASTILLVCVLASGAAVAQNATAAQAARLEHKQAMGRKLQWLSGLSASASLSGNLSAQVTSADATDLMTVPAPETALDVRQKVARKRLEAGDPSAFLNLIRAQGNFSDIVPGNSTQ